DLLPKDVNGLRALESYRLVEFSDTHRVRSETWSFTWENSILGTSRLGAALDGDVLRDLGAAFCFRGVEGASATSPGDKVYLTGCGTDADCGADQACYIDPAGPDVTRGLC